MRRSWIFLAALLAVVTIGSTLLPGVAEARRHRRCCGWDRGCCGSVSWCGNTCGSVCDSGCGGYTTSYGGWGGSACCDSGMSAPAMSSEAGSQSQSTFTPPAPPEGARPQKSGNMPAPPPAR